MLDYDFRIFFTCCSYQLALRGLNLFSWEWFCRRMFLFGIIIILVIILLESVNRVILNLLQEMKLAQCRFPLAWEYGSAYGV